MQSASPRFPRQTHLLLSCILPHVARPGHQRRRRDPSTDKPTITMKPTTLGLAALSLVLLTTNIARAEDATWKPYLGTEAGIDLVSGVRFGKSGVEYGTTDITFKSGAAIGLEAGFTHGRLFLGAELHYSQAKLDTLTWTSYDGVVYAELHAMDGQLRQLTLAPTVGYRLFAHDRFSVIAQLTAGWLRREFADVKHEDYEDGTAAVLDEAKSTWLIKPSLVLGYALGEHSSIKLRYAYAFSGKTTATDLTYDEDEGGDRNPDVSAIKTHSLSLGYSYQF